VAVQFCIYGMSIFKRKVEDSEICVLIVLYSKRLITQCSHNQWHIDSEFDEPGISGIRGKVSKPNKTHGKKSTDPVVHNGVLKLPEHVLKVSPARLNL